MQRIIGLLISGFAVRTAGAVAAVYVAITVGGYLSHVLATVNHAMGALN